MSRRAYLAINIIFFALIAGILLYCYFINSVSTPVICIHQRYLGIDCPSCGLTRSIAALLHFDLKTSLQFNKYGWQIFLFFLIQLASRLFLTGLILFTNKSLKNVCKVDGILSLILFLLCFYPFIIFTFSLAGK